MGRDCSFVSRQETQVVTTEKVAKVAVAKSFYASRRRRTGRAVECDGRRRNPQRRRRNTGPNRLWPETVSRSFVNDGTSAVLCVADQKLLDFVGNCLEVAAPSR